MKRILFSLLLIGSIFISQGCGGDYIYKETIEISGETWSYGEVVDFDFMIEDTLKKYNLTLEVTHSGDYGYQNLYVQFHTRHPSGETKSQVVSLELASKSGIWNGQCSGNSCTVEIPLQVNAVFDESGQHSINIEQYMRESPLRGIKSITMRITEGTAEQ